MTVQKKMIKMILFRHLYNGLNEKLLMIHWDDTISRDSMLVRAPDS